jgi:hypothetical protein
MDKNQHLVDAMQQAMSALSVGIYQQEAVEVLDRIGDEFTKPIQQLCGQQKDATASPVPIKFIVQVCEGSAGFRVGR